MGRKDKGVHFGDIDIDLDSIRLSAVDFGVRTEDYDKHNLKWQKTKRFAEDTGHRRGLVLWVKYVVSLWLSGVLFVVAFNTIFQLNLSDSVLITLLTTTTVNILGLAYIVLKGLFKLTNTD